MTDIMHYTEASALASCEQRWYYTHEDLLEEASKTRGLFLGTLLDVGVGRWYQGLGATLPDRWTDSYLVGRGTAPEDAQRSVDDFASDVVSDALWLLGRYSKHYGETPPSNWELVQTQDRIRWEHNGIVISGSCDGIVRIDGKLWLIEVKSYGNRDRLTWLDADPQLTWYALAMQQFYGELPYGILFDGIYTYRWKRDEHAPGDSFDRRFLDKTEDQVAASIPRLDSLLALRETLRTGERSPITNLGMACKSCGFRAKCHTELSGHPAIEKVIVDE